MVVWLSRVYQPNSPICLTLLLYLLDTHAVMNAGTISNDIQNDLTKFIHSIDLSEVNLNDFMRYLFTGVTSSDSVVRRFSFPNSYAISL